MRRIITLALIFLSTVSFAQTVSNIKVSRNDSFFTITYHLNKDADNVQCYMSLDGGKTFSNPLKQLYGDVGKVAAGDHTIYWDSQSEFEDKDCSLASFKLTTGAPEEKKPVTNFVPELKEKVKEQVTKHITTPAKVRIPRSEKKVTFQFEVGPSFSSVPKSGVTGVGAFASAGIFINNSFGGHYIAPVIEMNKACANIMLEYRIYACFHDEFMRGAWMGFNIGGNLSGGEYDITSKKTVNVSKFAAHYIIGWQVKKWMNLRLSAGGPDISFGVAFNLSNLFK